MTKKSKQRLSRRRFIGGSLTAAAGAGIGLPAKILGRKHPVQEKQDPKVKAFRTLGRTGFKVADIGYGSGELEDAALLGAILDAGVNYIDTAEGYGRGRSERIIGEVISKRDRKSVFVSTKVGVGRRDTKERIIERANKQLERLQSDYMDCFMMHMPSTQEALNNEHFHNAARQLKAEGKIRFVGLSNHGPQWNDVPETMEQVCLAAAEDERFDVMLFVYNFVQQDMGRKILQACKEKNVGATLMKTNPVLNYQEMKANLEGLLEEGQEMNKRSKDLLARLKDRSERAEAFKARYGLDSFDEIRRAAIKFCLDNGNVSCVCPTIKNYDDLDFYTALSGQKFDLKARQALSIYEALYGGFYCRHACGECESQCPESVPVNTIMRYNHYFKAQGREKTAMTKYASLPDRRADRCTGCAGHCERACPYGVPIQGLLALAHDTLTLG